MPADARAPRSAGIVVGGGSMLILLTLPDSPASTGSGRRCCHRWSISPSPRCRTTWWAPWRTGSVSGSIRWRCS